MSSPGSGPVGALRVVVLHDPVGDDAPPDELDLLDQVAAVESALRTAGFAAQPLALSLDLAATRSALVRASPDLVFNLIEGQGGNGRLALLGPLLLGDLGIAYTGTGLEGMAVSASKLLAKRALTAADLPTPAWITLADAGGGADDWDGSWIVKSVWEHASVGIDDGAVVSRGRVAETLAKRSAEYGGEWFAEAFVRGREINLAILADDDDLEVLPPAEIRFDDFPADKPHIVNYAAKWDSASFEYRHARRSFDFAPREAGLLAELEVLARRCASACTLTGYARIDVRVDAGGRPWVIDVNANPCLSPDAGFVANAARAGLSYDALVGRIAADGLRRGRCHPTAVDPSRLSEGRTAVPPARRPAARRETRAPSGPRRRRSSRPTAPRAR